MFKREVLPTKSRCYSIYNNREGSFRVATPSLLSFLSLSLSLSFREKSQDENENHSQNLPCKIHANNSLHK